MGGLRNVPLRIKLTAAFLAIVLLLVIVSFYQVRSLQHLNADYQQRIAAAVTSQQPGLADHTRTEADAAVKRLLVTTVTIKLVVMGLAILIGFAVMERFSRSLSQLKAGAARLSNGDFSKPIPVQSHDELGQLAQGFNTMAQRLRESYRRAALEQQRDEAMLQSLGEGLIVIDEAGLIVLVNSVAINLVGLKSREELIGKPIQDAYQLYGPDLKNPAAQPLPYTERPSYLAMRQGTIVDDVFGLHRADGQKLLLNITATPVKLEGTLVGAITVLRDVTKEKEVDRMKTEFISLASHQLRTPLSAIRWFGEMLLNGDAGKLLPEQEEFIQNITDSTLRMIALVTALLNISRIESGRIVIDPQPTDLKELVHGIVQDLTAKIEEKKQTLIISVHDELPKINIDPRLIGQVYLNLLTNAIKYTPKGGEISVFISRKDDQIVSQVTDNGYGIPKDQQSHVFQKFFRATNAAKIETDGTGLGLYLIKAVVDSSGGKLWFKSEEGQGTTFWFTMPTSGMKPKEGEVTLDA